MKRLSELFTLLGVVMVAVGLMIFIFQAVTWFSTGVWNVYPLSTVVSTPIYFTNPGEWQGLSKMALWLLAEVPASFVLMSVGTALVVIFSQIAKEYK